MAKKASSKSRSSSEKSLRKSGSVKSKTIRKGGDKSVSKRGTSKAASSKPPHSDTLGRSVKKSYSSVPPGYLESKEGVFLPEAHASPVPSSRLKSGFKKARKEIEAILDEIAATMTQDYSISEIELVASFSADGKFMGIGVGGAASIKFKIVPNK